MTLNSSLCLHVISMNQDVVVSSCVCICNAAEHVYVSEHTPGSSRLILLTLAWASH